MPSPIEHALSPYGSRLPGQAPEQLRQYWTVLREWSEAVNLTACETERDFAQVFITDVLTVLAFEDQIALGPLVDIGSGAGNPGIPLAIAWPERSVTLIDSRQRRCAFLRHACNSIDLRNVRVIEGRAEELAHEDEHREQYAVAAARAFGPAPWAVECAAPFVRSGGQVCLFLSSKDASQLVSNSGALHRLGLEVPNQQLSLSGGEGKGIVLVPKTQSSAAEYPRREKSALRHPVY